MSHVRRPRAAVPDQHARLGRRADRARRQRLGRGRRFRVQRCAIPPDRRDP